MQSFSYLQVYESLMFHAHSIKFYGQKTTSVSMEEFNLEGSKNSRLVKISAVKWLVCHC